MPEEHGEIRDSLKRIENCLLGDEKMGQIGLVSRVDQHAKRLQRLERWCLYMMGAGGAIVVVYHVVIDLLQTVRA